MRKCKRASQHVINVQQRLVCLIDARIGQISGVVQWPEEVALFAVGIGTVATECLEARPTRIADEAVIVPIVEVGVHETRLVHVTVADCDALFYALCELYVSLSTYAELLVVEFALLKRIDNARGKRWYIDTAVRLARDEEVPVCQLRILREEVI